MNYNDVIKKVATEFQLPEEHVDKVYRSFWQYVRTNIENLPLDNELTEEEFSQLRTNFNIPSLGKLNCIYDKYKVIKEKYNHIKALKDGIKNNKS